jgi:hypothetical protein
MKKDLGAMKVLGFDDKKVGIIFDRRNLGNDFNALRVNKFKPFEIPEGLVDEYIRNARQNGYANPLTPQTFREINEVIRQLYGLYLDSPYPSLMREMNIGNVSALPPTPTPIVQPKAQAANPNTNLTRTQQALLSPEEQVIASRT